MDWELVGIKGEKNCERKKGKTRDGGVDSVIRSIVKKRDKKDEDEIPKIFVICSFKESVDDDGNVWYCHRLRYQFGKYNAYCWYGNTMSGSRCPFDIVKEPTDEDITDFIRDYELLFEQL